MDRECDSGCMEVNSPSMEDSQISLLVYPVVAEKQALPIFTTSPVKANSETLPVYSSLVQVLVGNE